MKSSYCVIIFFLLGTMAKSQVSDSFSISKFLGSAKISIAKHKSSVLLISRENIDIQKINKRIFPIYVTFQANISLANEILSGSKVFFNVDSLQQVSAILIEVNTIEQISKQIIAMTNKLPNQLSFTMGNSDYNDNYIKYWEFKNCRISLIQNPIFQGVIISNGKNSSFCFQMD